MSVLARLAPRERRLLAFVVLLALALRVALVLEYEARHPLADRPVIDEASYERWALEVAGGDWLGDEVFFQEPLYPYWLGAVYALAGPAAETEDGTPRALPRQRTVARHLQAFLGALAAGLVFLLAHRLFGAGAALVAGLGAATHAPLVLLPALLLKPNLLVPLLSALVLVLLAARLPARASPRALAPWLAAGVLAGLGALLRGNVLLLLPLLALLPFARARRATAGARAWRASAALVAGVALVLAPVALRNLAVGGVFALTTTGAGTNVYGGNAPENPYGRASELDWVRGIPEHELDDWRHEAERRSGRTLDPGEVSAFWLRETLRSVAARPRVHLAILWRKLRLTLGAYEVPDNHDLVWDARHLALLRALPGWRLWGWLGLGGALLLALRRALRVAPPRDPAGARELLALAGLYVATIVLTVTSMRARLAIVPLLLPFAGWMASVAAASFSAGRRALERLGDAPATRTGLAAWLVPLALVAPAVLVPVLSAAARAEELADRDFNLAVYRLEDPRGIDEAEAIARRLAQEHPRSSRVETLLAEIAFRRGLAREDPAAASALFAEALGRLRRVVEAEGVGPRERFRARSLAAWIQYEARNWPAAERSFRAALAFDPDARELRLGLANVLFLVSGDLAPGDERTSRLRESEALLRGLLAEEESAELRERLDQVRAELGG